MFKEPVETRLQTLESNYRWMRAVAIALTVICVITCGLVGYLAGRVEAAVQTPGFHNENGIASLEVSQLSIKTPSGDERVRLDPNGLLVFGDKEKREQARLEFGGLRFLKASGESSRFDSNELVFVDDTSGLSCTLDGRRLACSDKKGAGLGTTLGFIGNAEEDANGPTITVLNKTGRIIWKAP